jgi:hypothetical protein
MYKRLSLSNALRCLLLMAMLLFRMLNDIRLLTLSTAPAW